MVTLDPVDAYTQSMTSASSACGLDSRPGNKMLTTKSGKHERYGTVGNGRPDLPIACERLEQILCLSGYDDFMKKLFAY